MTTDRQKICKCGDNVAEFLKDINIFEANLREVDKEDSTIFVPSFKLSIDSIYRNINKIEDDCGIDANNIKWSRADIFNKIEKMELIKDTKAFNENKSNMFEDLSRIRYGVVQKIKNCSEK